MLIAPVVLCSQRAGLTHFEEVLGQDGFYSLMVLSFSIPALPVLLLMNRFDRAFDMRFSAKRAYHFRIAMALGMMGA